MGDMERTRNTGSTSLHASVTLSQGQTNVWREKKMASIIYVLPHIQIPGFMYLAQIVITEYTFLVDRRTYKRTDRLTDRRQTYSPLRCEHRQGTINTKLDRCFQKQEPVETG